MPRMPTLFLSHGSPMHAVQSGVAGDMWQAVGAALPRSRALVIASAHWETSRPMLTGSKQPETIHDFGGFPEALYRIRYAAPGAPDLAARAAQLLRDNGLDAAVDPQRGLDHGAWVPLMLMYPEYDIPVTQVSIQSRLGPAHHLRLGRAISGLRQDALILCTGSFTHSLRLMDRSGVNAPEPQWVREFSDYIHMALIEGRTDDLLKYRQQAPFAERAHPEDDHFMPLFVAVGAGGSRARAERLHASATYGTLRMDAYAFS